MRGGNQNETDQSNFYNGMPVYIFVYAGDGVCSVNAELKM